MGQHGGVGEPQQYRNSAATVPQQYRNSTATVPQQYRNREHGGVGVDNATLRYLYHRDGGFGPWGIFRPQTWMSLALLDPTI